MIIKFLKNIFKKRKEGFFNVIEIRNDKDSDEPICKDAKVYYFSQKNKNDIETNLLKSGYIKMLLTNEKGTYITEIFLGGVEVKKVKEEQNE